MKTTILLFILFSVQAFASSSADEDVKVYVESQMAMILEDAKAFSGYDDLYFDENLTCYSAYTKHPEIGFCRISGANENLHSTFLILVKENKPGAKRKNLAIQVAETSRIYFR